MSRKKRKEKQQLRRKRAKQSRKRNKQLHKHRQQLRQQDKQAQSSTSDLFSLFDIVGHNEMGEALYRMPSIDEIAQKLGLPVDYDKRSSPMRVSDLRSDAAYRAAHKANMAAIEIVDARFTKEERDTEAYHQFFFRTWLQLRPDGEQISTDELCRLFNRDKETIQGWKTI